MARKRRRSIGDTIVLLVIVAALVWVFAPGVGWDLLGLRGAEKDSKNKRGTGIYETFRPYVYTAWTSYGTDHDSCFSEFLLADISQKS